MILARVIGTVVATVKHPVLVGHKLLLVQPVETPGRGPEAGGRPGQAGPGPARPDAGRGRSTLALDAVQAGPGDTVLLLEEGNSSRMILGDSMAPVRSMVVGIVDAVVAGEDT